MKKENIFFTLLVILLLSGCQRKTEPEALEEVQGNVLATIADEIGKIEVVDIDIQWKNASGKNADTERWYSSDNIVNFKEAIYTFDAYSAPREHISREIAVGVYSEKFPESLQEILVYVNDDIPGDEDKAWMEYEADCDKEKVSLEVDPYIAFEDIDALAADIDLDGEKEYIISFLDGGTAHNICTIVARLIDGEWVQIGGHSTENSATRALLEWENQYYLLMGDCLTYWNGGEEPNWKEHPAPGQAECWIRLIIKKTITGYTPLEVYRLEGEFADFLQNADMTNPEGNSIEDMESSAWAYWEGEANTFLVRYAWTQGIEGEEYRYIVSEITSGTDYQSDLLLTVCRQREDKRLEAVALYYLMANYEMEFLEK